KNIPVAEVYTMDELISKSVADRKFNLIMLASFAGLALLLAAIGIYGVISFIVRQKIHEIGIRVVLGASNRDIYRMILGKGFALTIAGVVFGLCASLFLTRFLQVMLFEVSRNDFATMLVGVSVLSITALVATFLPARRAVKLDPSSALR